MHRPDQEQLLLEAKKKAGLLLEGLLRDQADLQRNASTLAAQSVAEGRAAHAAAVDAARLTIDNLQRSLVGMVERPSGTSASGANQD